MPGRSARFKPLLYAVLIVAVGVGAPVFALSPAGGEPVFKHLTQEDGLSQNTIYDILEDRKGFIWLATQDGLNKYDGYGFTVFRPEVDNPNSLSSQYLRCLYEDKNGVLWIGTENAGLNKYDPATGKFTVYRHTPGDPDSINPGSIRAILEDNQGNLWIGSTSCLELFDRETSRFRHYRNIEGDPRTLSNNVILSLLEDKNGTLWVGTAWGLNRYNPGAETFTRFHYQPDRSRRTGADAVNALLEDHSGEFWVGTFGGLMRFDRKTGGFSVYNHNEGNPSGLISNNVMRIYEDKGNVLWIATTEGLEQFDRRREAFIHYRADEQNPTSLSSNIILSIFESRSGILWVGTGGGGLNKFDREGARFYTYRPNPPGFDSIIFSIYEDSNGELWCGANIGGIYRFNRRTNKTVQYRNDPGDSTSLVFNDVRAIREDAGGEMWIGTTNGLDRFDKKDGTFIHYRPNPDDPTSLSHPAIRSFLLDRSGNFWICTDNGLNRLDKRTDPYSFKVYRHHPENPDSLTRGPVFSIMEGHKDFLWLGTFNGLERLDRSNGTFSHFPLRTGEQNLDPLQAITSVLEDREKRIWAATLGSGLYLFDRETGKYTPFREKDGLPNNVVYCIMEDGNGFLWLSTNNGLSKFNPDTRTFKNYNTRDGLQSNEFNLGSYFKNKHGEMFFGGVRGFNSFFPGRVKDNPHAPPVVLTDFRVFNRPVPFGKDKRLDKPVCSAEKIVLSHKDTVFSFEFVALDYTIPEKNQYAYMLEGFDEDWIYTSSDKRFASYTNMDPGEYTFRVKGSNNDGVWNEKGASIVIIVKPPFWKTWWFQLLAALFLVTTAALWYKKRVRDLSYRTRLTTELQTAHDAQMSIMPQQDPLVPGFDISGACVPASEVGGDFFDYLWLTEARSKFGIAIGDVSGKAMKAAMTAVMSDGILFSKADESDSIHEIMTRVNRPIYLKTDRKMFTALCLASIDLKSKELAFTNAGLNHPLLKSGGKVFHLKGKGPKFPLGIHKDNHYEEQRHELKSGDILLFFTDGIPDACNPAGDFFELSRLERFLEQLDTAGMTAVEIKNCIIDEVMAFSGSASQQDDLTLVVVKTL